MTLVLLLIRYHKPIVFATLIACAAVGIRHSYNISYEQGRSYGVMQMQKEVNTARNKVAVIEAHAKEQSAIYATQLYNANQQYTKLKTQLEEKGKARDAKIKHILESTVYHNRCFDSDGMYELNRAIADQ